VTVLQNYHNFDTLAIKHSVLTAHLCLQCFDTVGWVEGRAASL